MPKRIPAEVVERARRLRAAGESVKRIAAQLDVSVAWVSLTVRDVALTAEQRAELYSYRRGARALGQVVRSAHYRRQRLFAQERGRELARTAGGDFIAGCMLYWAEGAKDRNSLALSNADPEMLRYWLSWLRRWLAVDDDALAVSINCHLGNGLSAADIEAWWLSHLGLPVTCLRKTQVNKVSVASKRVRRPLLYGTVTITVNSTEAVQLVYGAIQEYGGFSRPEWLDMGTVAA